MAFDFSAGTVVPANNNQASTPAPNNNGSAPAGFHFNSGTPTNAGATPTITPPAAPAPAPTTASGPTSLGGVADSVSGAINTGIDTAQNSIFSPLSWLGKVGGGIVGAAGGLIGGAEAGVLNPIKNIAQGNPIFQNWGSDVAKNAAATAQFGYNIGDQGVKSAPFMGLGKVPGAVIGANQLYQGGKAIASGKYEDSVLPIITGLASLYGASQSTGSLINKGLPSDVNASGDVNVTPPAGTPPSGPGSSGLILNKTMTDDASAAQNIKNANKMMSVDPANMTKGEKYSAEINHQTTPRTGLFGKSGINVSADNARIAQQYAPLFNTGDPESVIQNFNGILKTTGQARDGLLAAHPLIIPPEGATGFKNLLSQKVGGPLQDIIDQSPNPEGIQRIANRTIENLVNRTPKVNPASPDFNLANYAQAQRELNGTIDYSPLAKGGDLSALDQVKLAIRNGARDVIGDKLNSLGGGIGDQYKTLTSALRDQENAVRSVAKYAAPTLGKNRAGILLNKALEPLSGPIGYLGKKILGK